MNHRTYDKTPYVALKPLWESLGSPSMSVLWGTQNVIWRRSPPPDTAPLVCCVPRAAQLGLQVQVGQNLTRVEKKLDQVGQDTEGLPLERRALKVSRGCFSRTCVGCKQEILEKHHTSCCSEECCCIAKDFTGRWDPPTEVLA